MTTDPGPAREENEALLGDAFRDATLDGQYPPLWQRGPEEWGRIAAVALAPYVAVQVAEKDAEATRFENLAMDLAGKLSEADEDVASLNAALLDACQVADAALARVDAARRDALAPVLALLDRVHVVQVQSIEGMVDAPVIWPHELRAAVESPDQPEGPGGCCSFPKTAQGKCPGCGTPAPDQPEEGVSRDDVAAAIRSVGHDRRDGGVDVDPATAADAVLALLRSPDQPEGERHG